MLKKISIIVALSLLLASSAFAAAGVSVTMASPLTAATTGLTLYGSKTTATATEPLIGKTSTGVGVGVFCNAAGTGYSLISQHVNGTKMFGTSYDSTSIFSKSVATVGTPLPAVPTAVTTADFASWSAM